MFADSNSKVPWFDPAAYGCYYQGAGWSSPVARWAHNPKVPGSNPGPATNNGNNLPYLSNSEQNSQKIPLDTNRTASSATATIQWVSWVSESTQPSCYQPDAFYPS
jgi:hypothetical protein